MKKLKLNIILIVSSFIALIAGLAVVMVIAPGADILGLKYIRATSGSIDTAESYYVGDLLQGDIVVNGDNILTKVNFVQSYSFTVRLVDIYNGYCRSDADPDVKMEIVDGIINFTSNEYHPFVYHNRSEDSALYINIPIYLKGRVTVNCKSSNVVVCGMSGTLDELVINTSGKVTVEDGARLNNLNINVSSKKVTIGENVELNGNVSIKSSNSDVTILCPVSGNINMESKGGSLKFKSCKDLTLKASSTSVGSSYDGVNIVNGTTNIETNDDVNLRPVGEVNIVTKRGKVTIGETDGEINSNVNVTTKSGKITTIGKFTGETNLTTNSGDFVISWLKNSNIKTTYGQVDANRIDSGTINAGNSNVTILFVQENINIVTRGGDVKLGSKSSSFDGSATIKTTVGDVNINNAKGKSYEITTEYGDIVINAVENNKSNLKLTSYRGDITANNCCAETEIKSNGKINCTVISRTAKMVIEGKNKEVCVKLKYKYVYSLHSNKLNNIYINGEVIESSEDATGSVYDPEPSYGGLDRLKVSTNKGKIVIQDA